jgi:large subunit ribosomal protein L21
MYAVVRTGSKQLRVAPGDVVAVERLEGAPGAVRVGTPYVEGARVVGTIQGQDRGPKIKIFKYRRRKRYRLRKGHRQSYTSLKIESIEV